MPRCKARSCGAEIVFGITERGKRMPLNAETITVQDAMERDWRGVFTFIDDSEKIALAGPLEPGIDLYLTHFATCPESASFQRRSAA